MHPQESADTGLGTRVFSLWFPHPTSSAKHGRNQKELSLNYGLLSYDALVRNVPGHPFLRTLRSKLSGGEYNERQIFVNNISVRATLVVVFQK